MNPWRTVANVCLLLPASIAAQSPAQVVVDHNPQERARAGFRFANVPPPVVGDAARTGKFAIVNGRRDRNGGDLAVLNDGRLPEADDAPAANFFFAAGSDGGRLTLDLGSVSEVRQINTYSWHKGARGPQVYALYAADGATPNFDPAPGRGTDPLLCGWQPVASVDTRAERGVSGGQYGVSIADASGMLGKFRHLLFDVRATGTDDQFGNTFFSEIDVITPTVPGPVQPTVARTEDGEYEITVDATQAPELSDWAKNRLAPVLLEWYPRIVAMLPSEGFTAPTRFSVVFENPGRGVAATGGTRITCAATWFAANLEGEAIGAVVHELVHVAQQYRRARGANRADRPATGWLTEGIADYIRWFLYEPGSHGADRVRNPASARHDAGYRISANFLNWVSETHDKDIVRKLNAALREGSYTDAVWQTFTGKTLAELGQAWKESLTAEAPTAAADANLNVLTEAEQQAGWKLLFDGTSFEGWHSFKRDGVRPGWQVKDGAILCADPHDAGDLCTDAQYGAFELVLDYNIAAGGNSGIMFHVTDAGSATWATGPECQLLDNKAGRDPQKAGWLYGLYQADVDATRPAGEWNRLRLLITPEKCEHEMNGVKYFEYVPHSADFARRLAQSKFASMPHFARSETGYIALQGDHGLISFRNIKLRELPPK